MAQRKPSPRKRPRSSQHERPSLFFIFVLLAALLFLAWGVMRIVTTPIEVPESGASAPAEQSQE